MIVARGPNEDSSPTADGIFKGQKAALPHCSLGTELGISKETRIKSKAVMKHSHSEAFAVLYICD